MIAGPSEGRCAALRVLLGGSPGIAVCGEAYDGAAAVRVAQRERPDLCLVSDEPGFDSAALMAVLAGRLPHVRTVLSGVEPDDDRLLAAVAAGASGYVEADAEPGAFASALFDVASGHPAFPRRLARLLIARLRAEARGV